MDEAHELTSGYRVMVDDNFDFMDEDERVCVGTFRHFAEALAKAQAITAESVFRHRGNSAEETCQAYLDLGDDPFIVPFGDAPIPTGRYSAWEHAQELARVLHTENGE